MSEMKSALFSNEMDKKIVNEFRVKHGNGGAGGDVEVRGDNSGGGGGVEMTYSS